MFKKMLLSALLFVAVAPGQVWALDTYDYGYYDSYDAGFDETDSNDDWFFDYYDYDDNYSYYGDTDWFDWEEDGLF